MSRTHAAFLFSCEKMHRWFEGSIYFWTFTWKKVQPSWRYLPQWNQFMRELQNRYGGMIKGLRVIEMHPGEFSHGFHFHALLNMRVSIHWVRRVSKKYGIGRIEVKKVNQKEQMYYLAKYLTKDEIALPKGMRRWGTIGGWSHTRNSDIQIQSTFHDNFREVQNIINKKQLDTNLVHTIYQNTQLYGSIQNWPIKEIVYHGKSAKRPLLPLVTKLEKKNTDMEQIAIMLKQKAARINRKEKESAPQAKNFSEKTVRVSTDYWLTYPGSNNRAN